MDEPSYCPLQGGTKERKQKDLVWRKEDDSCPACFTVKHFTRGRRRKKKGKKRGKKREKEPNQWTTDKHTAQNRHYRKVVQSFLAFWTQFTDNKHLWKNFREPGLDCDLIIHRRKGGLKNYFQNKPLDDQTDRFKWRVRYKVVWLCQRRQGEQDLG